MFQLIAFVFFATSLKAQTATQFVPTAPERTDVHSEVDKDAEFPGGYKELMRFVYKNVKYSEHCILHGDISKIHVRLTIEKDGTVSLVQIKNGFNKDYCINLILRSVQEWTELMPKWNPAVLNGENVASYFILPINFHPK